MRAERHAAVVVGAGPAGLAAAAMLRRAGIGTVVLERGGEVGAAWRTRYDRLHLHTVRWLSSLPGYRFPRRFGKWPSRDAVCDYLAAYARHHDLAVRTGIEVTRVDEAGRGWALATSQGPVEADRVVVATGYNAVPVLPDWPGRDVFGGELVHSADYRHAGPYRGRDVLVVGAGNSAAEIALDLAEDGARRVLLGVRTPPHIVKRDTLGLPSQLVGIGLSRLPPAWTSRIARFLRRRTIPDLTPHGLPAPDEPPGVTFARTWMIPILDVGIVAAIRSGRVEVVGAPARFEPDAAVLADGSRLPVDAVVAATGFRPALDGLVGHLGVLDERGLPRADEPLAGLHFVGFTVTLGGTFRRIAHEARELARSVREEREEDARPAVGAA